MPQREVVELLSDSEDEQELAPPLSPPSPPPPPPPAVARQHALGGASPKRAGAKHGRDGSQEPPPRPAPPAPAAAAAAAAAAGGPSASVAAAAALLAASRARSQASTNKDSSGQPRASTQQPAGGEAATAAAGGAAAPAAAAAVAAAAACPASAAAAAAGVPLDALAPLDWAAVPVLLGSRYGLAQGSSFQAVAAATQEGLGRRLTANELSYLRAFCQHVASSIAPGSFRKFSSPRQFKVPPRFRLQVQHCEDAGGRSEQPDAAAAAAAVQAAAAEQNCGAPSRDLVTAEQQERAAKRRRLLEDAAAQQQGSLAGAAAGGLSEQEQKHGSSLRLMLSAKQRQVLQQHRTQQQQPQEANKERQRQRQQQLKEQQLQQQFKVWPPLPGPPPPAAAGGSGSSSGQQAADLIPTCVSVGTARFMAQLIAATQPVPAKRKQPVRQQDRGGKAPAAAAAAAGGTEAGAPGSKPKRQAASLATDRLRQQALEGTGGAAAAAAARLLQQQQQRGDGESASGTAGAGSGSRGTSQREPSPPCSQGRSGDGDVTLGGGSGSGCLDAPGQQPEQQPPQQQQQFTWADAPQGCFYKVETRLSKRRSACLDAQLLPQQLLPAGVGWDQAVRDMEQRTRVALITDQCHPCIRNPIRPATMEVGEPHMLLAATQLEKGAVLGLYFGSTRTATEDTAVAAGDLTCAGGLDHAYTMTVSWSKEVCELVSARCELVIAGNKAGCRMGLVNDITAWGEQMPGPCPQAATGRCNCSMYVNRAANVTWWHLVYRAVDGSYCPVVAAVASEPVTPGSELLANYELHDAEFWSAVRSNLAQHHFFSTLAANNKVLSSILEQILEEAAAAAAAGGASSGNGGAGAPAAPAQGPLLARIQQLAASGMQQHETYEAEVATMLAEARAAYGEDGTPVLQPGGAAAAAAGGGRRGRATGQP